MPEGGRSIMVGGAADFIEGYDPAVTHWTLTETGTRRVENNIFPPNIGLKGAGALLTLHRLGVVEEDELGGFLGETKGDVKRLMKRLMGFGLVQQVS